MEGSITPTLPPLITLPQHSVIQAVVDIVGSPECPSQASQHEYLACLNSSIIVAMSRLPRSTWRGEALVAYISFLNNEPQFVLNGQLYGGTIAIRNLVAGDAVRKQARNGTRAQFGRRAIKKPYYSASCGPQPLRPRSSDQLPADPVALPAVDSEPTAASSSDDLRDATTAAIAAATRHESGALPVAADPTGPALTNEHEAQLVESRPPSTGPHGHLISAPPDPPVLRNADEQVAPDVPLVNRATFSAPPQVNSPPNGESASGSTTAVPIRMDSASPVPVPIRAAGPAPSESACLRHIYRHYPMANAVVDPVPTAPTASRAKARGRNPYQDLASAAVSVKTRTAPEDTRAAKRSRVDSPHRVQTLLNPVPAPTPVVGVATQSVVAPSSAAQQAAVPAPNVPPSQASVTAQLRTHIRRLEAQSLQNRMAAALADAQLRVIMLVRRVSSQQANFLEALSAQGVTYSSLQRDINYANLHIGLADACSLHIEQERGRILDLLSQLHGGPVDASSGGYFIPPSWRLPEPEYLIPLRDNAT
ncbi:hypothetical protein MIND_00916300 [Mycena indigotica]|uniref:Uncharacterized protein n=1 Tax=Mycena indigotica TaxID=2126181 RepID=A0A8H6SDP3_9AGAR|nr:uncharacterized protein MIND_00916300 [Mycena indigotica]KAF7296850.1 hypothetical protein MIND_00916300 [Mycena indigotica]